MRTTIVRCGGCESALALPAATGAGGVSCLRCGAETAVWLYPALHRPRGGEAAQTVQDDSHSSCMNHPQKRATVICDGCGKFLCALCDVEWNGEHLCTDCIAHRKSEDPEQALRTEYVHYDLIALMLALLAIPLISIAIIIAPVVLFMAWRFWSVPWRSVPHRKWIMVLAALMACLEIAGWVGFVTVLVNDIRSEIS